jgi:oligopeptide transport system ATP-binding protein
MTTILNIENLKTYFPIRKGVFSKVVGNVHAVNGVSLEIKKGETLGLVGESGCGKSTLGKTILQLEKATSGSIKYSNTELIGLSQKELKPFRSNMQMVFQDPFSSLDPRMTIEKIIAEPLKLHNIGDKESHKKLACELLEKVGLSGSILHRYPHEFSGGQRQRIGIARALALKPEIIIADEPVAALDVSVQAQVLNLMNDLKKEFGLTYVFISHDLGVIKYFSDRIAVMYLGKIVELSTSENLYKHPIHPYTRALISSIPASDPEHKIERTPLKGDVPSPISPPPGCTFHTRCPFVKDICKTKIPELETFDIEGTKHQAACHFSNDFLNRN